MHLVISVKLYLISPALCIADVQTLDTMQALCLPLGASISLLVMFFFFDSMQMLFAICTASKYILVEYQANKTTKLGDKKKEA